MMATDLSIQRMTAVRARMTIMRVVDKNAPFETKNVLINLEPNVA
jgi:hypothetical protein